MRRLAIAALEEIDRPTGELRTLALEMVGREK